MTGRIITVRHGRPALSRKVIHSAKEFGEWWKLYDEGGLQQGDVPPQALRDLAQSAKTLLASPMPRAIETAQLIAPVGLSVQSDVLFVEAPLPPPPLPDWVKFSPRVWGVLSRSWWTFGYAPGDMETRPQTWVRIDRIINVLSEHAGEGDVILCAHGYINWMMSRRMKRHGWALEKRRSGNKHWSHRVYTRP